MNGFGTIDTYATLLLETTRTASREQALKFRETLRMQLRAFEDMHGLPHSFQTKTEAERERADLERMASSGRSER